MSRNRRISRRRLLAYAAGLAASLQGAALGRARPVERPRFPDDPFKLGVASGDPVPLGFVIWTRLAPLP
ncbi:MAG: alkaline phosphatase, partial [Sphingomonadales bacterium]|nr:alkaline phosphatase [Sphingomonadales bacterium]